MIIIILLRNINKGEKGVERNEGSGRRINKRCLFRQSMLFEPALKNTAFFLKKKRNISVHFLGGREKT